MTQASAVAGGEREHGGRLDAARQRWGRRAGDWLELSTGINPEPFPLPPLDLGLWTRLPDQALDAALRDAAAAAYGVPGRDWIVAAPGSQALIQWLPWLVGRTQVAILGPTYNEHAPAWMAAGHDVREVTDLDSVPPAASVAVAVNPNNPDGRLIDPDRLTAMAEHRLVVVDEAFADVAPEISVAAHVDRRDIIVLRSLGKFFGLAGLRLGFAIAGRARADRIRSALGPWAVSGPATDVGRQALLDDRWQAATRRHLAAAAADLDKLLVAAGLSVSGGTNLFRLVRTQRAQEVYEGLGQHGVLVRSFARHPTWLRFGLPPSTGFSRLEHALERVSGSKSEGTELRRLRGARR